MARPGLFQHPKFKRLIHLMGEPVSYVVGFLECLWQVGYSSGNPMIGDAKMVEICAEYPQKDGRLFAALLECGFIDEVSGGNYQIHDLLENAPGYVAVRSFRDQERRKVKKCSVCPIEFKTADRRAKYCSPACRMIAYRARQSVTDSDGSLRNGAQRDGTVTSRCAPPSPRERVLSVTDSESLSSVTPRHTPRSREVAEALLRHAREEIGDE